MSQLTIPDDWLPTAENIDALPERLKTYVQELVSLVAVVADLQDKLAKVQAVVKTVTQDSFRRLCQIYDNKAVEADKAYGLTNMKRWKVVADTYRQMAVQLRQSFGLVEVAHD